ncbi:MFS transporter [Streptomyces sp. HD]|uniref:MFS transporter n=1 Tax=Streptomyces sp. HD TaxID=3020892 RepID=UPI002330A57B|nr:MFS transporter [Streptomyces sp. HD]MDC0772754.1 MFS transporter [Streptomyces sp. HD]
MPQQPYEKAPRTLSPLNDPKAAKPPASPLLTLTADTLVAVDFTPRTTGGRRRPPGPYRRLFTRPGALAFTLANLTARLPMGMFSMSAVVMIAGSRGSYALAGAVSATGLAASALVAPWTARLVDRYGQARVAVPATLLAALGSLAMVLCVRYGAPDWTLFAAYAATATTPNTGGMSRARWAHLLKDDPDSLHAANSFEQSADELCFTLGPVLAAFLCGTFFPEAGTLAGVVLLVTGVLAFAAQRSTEPPPRGRTSGTDHTGVPTGDAGAAGTAAAKSPLRSPGMPPLLAVCLAMGAVFGSTEVVTIAFADAEGHRTAAGAVLALQAAGSCAAGLWFGRLGLSGSPEHRYPWCIAAMATLLTLPLLAATLTGSLPLLAIALLISGMATAPTMITNMTLVQHRTPEGHLNEGMTLAVTALLGGIAGGSAAGGWMAEHLSPTAGYGIPITAAATALLIALAATPLQGRGAESIRGSAARARPATTGPADNNPSRPS